MKEHLAKALRRRATTRRTAWKILRTWDGVPEPRNNVKRWLSTLREQLNSVSYSYGFFDGDYA